MSQDTRYGINIPQFHRSDRRRLIELGEFAVQAEDLGFDSLWTLDGSLHDIPFLEPLSSLAYIAGLTKKVRLGTAVLILPVRTPLAVTKLTATIDFLSSGRFILGTALGGSRQEYAASGVPIGERVPRFVEAIKMMRKLWTEENVNFKGKFWTLEKATISPRPERSGGIPIWIGGSQIGKEVNEKAIRRAARIGDGWLGAGSTSLSAHENSGRKFIEYAREFGRDPASLAIAKRVYIHVDPNKETAKRKLEENLEAFYHRSIDVESICAYGGPEECVNRLRRLKESGTKTIIFHPVTEELVQARTIMRDVIPALGR